MDRFKITVGWISIIIMVVLTIYLIVFTFSHKELTNTQLFIANWWVIIPHLISLLGYHWAFKDN